VVKKKKAKKAKSAKSKPSKLMPKKKPKVTAKKQALSFAELSDSILSSLTVTAAAASAIKAVTFTKDNANVIVDVTTAGQNDVVPCTLNLPVGIYPLHYRAQGVGNFNVTVTGGELSHPIAGTAPDAGTLLIKVS
jgi:hypothetical protein